jgi:hypothetical protein
MIQLLILEASAKCGGGIVPCHLREGGWKYCLVVASHGPTSLRTSHMTVILLVFVFNNHLLLDLEYVVRGILNLISSRNDPP